MLDQNTLLALGLLALVIAVCWSLSCARQPSGQASLAQAPMPDPDSAEYAPPPHNPGFDVAGQSLEDKYCRDGLTQGGIVDGENELWRNQIYTVTPSMTNLKYQQVQM